MRTARFQTVRASVATTRCGSPGEGGGPRVNQVWTGLQCWPADVSSRSFLGWVGGGRYSTWLPQGVLYRVTYSMMHLMYLQIPCEQRDAFKLPSRNFVCRRNECPWDRYLMQGKRECMKWVHKVNDQIERKSRHVLVQDVMDDGDLWNLCTENTVALKQRKFSLCMRSNIFGKKAVVVIHSQVPIIDCNLGCPPVI